MTTKEAQKEQPRIKMEKLEVSEAVDLLARFMRSDGDDDEVLKTSFNSAQKDYIDEYAEIIVYIDSMFEKYKTAKWKEIWDDTKGDWIRNADGEIILHECTDAEKKIIQAHKEKAINILIAKVKSIVRTNRNSESNHFANIFSDYQNSSRKDEEDETTKSLYQKMKDKFKGEDKDDGDDD